MAWRENLNVNQLSLGNESINQSDGPQVVAFTIGAEAANVINVGMVFQDVNGAAMTVPGALKFYMSDNADGSTLSAGPTTLAVGTDGLAIESTANVEGTLISESTGAIDIDLGDVAVVSFYLCCILPTGKIAVSPVIAFT